MLWVEDPDGFVDRQLFDFPPDRDVYLEDLKVPTPDDVSNLKDVFKVVCVRAQYHACMTLQYMYLCR